MLDQDERRSLGLLLDCEYLIAELYSQAGGGIGLSPEQRGENAGFARGGRAVKFVNPTVAAFVCETMKGSMSHIAMLRQHLAELGEGAYAASAIDLDRSFTEVTQGAALTAPNQFFDAFVNETNLMLAAYMLEEVSMTACAHALCTLDLKWSREIFVGLYGSLSSRTAIVRAFLFAAGLSGETNAISVFRQKECGLDATAYQGNDHGVGMFEAPSMLPLTSEGLAWARSPAQCAAILTGHFDGTSGRFFPMGLNAINNLASRGLHLTKLYLSQVAQLGPEPSVHELAAFDAELVVMPPLSLDAEAYSLSENTPVQPWTQLDFTSCVPRCFEIKKAIVHSNVGIVGVGTHVIEETLWHTDPRRHRYKIVDGGVACLNIGAIEMLDETTVSILVGAAESYWHTVIDCVARLILVPDTCWPTIKRVLYPSTGIQVANLLAMWSLPPHIELREVKQQESFLTDTLVFPSSLHGLFDYHPALLKAAFARLASAVDLNAESPRLIYIDRRHSPLRVLVNENELIDALPGFSVVRLEMLTASEQARLFAKADVIVAPHGAGLTNIGFCRPGTVVVEMMMDAYCNWCYRRIAAIGDIHYICVLGRCLNYQEPVRHSRKWIVEKSDLKVAVEQAKRLVFT